MTEDTLDRQSEPTATTTCAGQGDPATGGPQPPPVGDAAPAWFLVRWEIDLEATSAAEAARAALAIQRNPASIATFFTVRPLDDPDAEIELDLLEGSNP